MGGHLPPVKDVVRAEIAGCARGRAGEYSFGCMDDNNDNQPGRRYVWPWFLLAALLLGVALAILWMSLEIRRTKERRDPNAPPPRMGSVDRRNDGVATARPKTILLRFL